jgi:hypothetical protein
MMWTADSKWRTRMLKWKKTSRLESIPVLILLGLLAGAVGGLGIGLIEMRATSHATSSSTGK